MWVGLMPYTRTDSGDFTLTALDGSTWEWQQQQPSCSRADTSLCIGLMLSRAMLQTGSREGLPVAQAARWHL